MSANIGMMIAAVASGSLALEVLVALLWLVNAFTFLGGGGRQALRKHIETYRRLKLYDNPPKVGIIDFPAPDDEGWDFGKYGRLDNDGFAVENPLGILSFDNIEIGHNYDAYVEEVFENYSRRRNRGGDLRRLHLAEEHYLARLSEKIND